MTLTGDTGPVGPGRVARAGPWWWSRRRGAVLDGFLALVSALECMAEGASFAGGHGWWPVLGAVVGLLVGGSLLLRRRWPIAVVLLALAVTPVSMGLVLGVVSLYTLAASKLPRRIIAALVAMMATGTTLVAFVELGRDLLRRDLGPSPWLQIMLSVVVALGLTAPPVLLGLYVGARRRLVESLRERADGLERELSLLAEKAGERAERARIEERNRIARDMHDVVAHRVSLMVVHASAVRAVLRTDPARAEDSAELLGDMGRQALRELRQMLGVLRTGADAVPGPAVDGGVADGGVAVDGGASVDGGVTGGGVAGDGGHRDVSRHDARHDVGRTAVFDADSVRDDAAPPGVVADGATAGGAVVPAQARDPRTGGVADGAATDGAATDGAATDGASLARLGVLVEQSRAAGMRVTFSQEGERRSLPARVERAAFRVVQEALTNAHKHAVGAATLVRVAYRAQEIAVLVENGPPDGRPSPGLPSGGNGLVGMRERVSALGGGFVAGPSRSGGFRVSAVIPAAP
ncbi:sensor histidine kinase [Streptantibioticus silvisoli]|uniref:histidine kinase n=1 Tax=Streptantibioticus silvisoli TaxID=2705255 RepID=A0ABT6WA36_9ACTN|nr:sensor histidine kinase [Streptantibioticus silvisoli]MDI5967420.1 histidine kinase [Streptantibioticus silvisoli]